MVKDVQAFLGFTGFYCYFVPNYSNIACPLIDLTKKAIPFHWDQPQFKAFETMKTLMCQKPILRQPCYDAPFFLAMDALAYGIGAVLSQEGEPNPHTQKPTKTPYHLLLSHFHPNQTKLWHIRTRTASHSQKPRTLATIPSSHWDSSHSLNRPCKPHLLEKSMKSKLQSSQMVHYTPRLQPNHQTHPWQATCGPGYAITTS